MVRDARTPPWRLWTALTCLVGAAFGGAVVDAAAQETRGALVPQRTSGARGRLNVIRHLVESVQYRQVTDAPVLLTPLDGAPAEERFAGPVKPIRGWY
jgi:hypothetical protein